MGTGHNRTPLAGWGGSIFTCFAYFKSGLFAAYRLPYMTDFDRPIRLSRFRLLDSHIARSRQPHRRSTPVTAAVAVLRKLERKLQLSMLMPVPAALRAVVVSQHRTRPPPSPAPPTPGHPPPSPGLGMRDDPQLLPVRPIGVWRCLNYHDGP